MKTCSKFKKKIFPNKITSGSEKEHPQHFSIHSQPTSVRCEQQVNAAALRHSTEPEDHSTWWNLSSQVLRIGLPEKWAAI